MTETTARYEYQEDRDDDGLNWARIAGISAAIAVHVAALMLLMAPVSPPQTASEQEDRVDVQFIEPPPPPPPPPPKEPPKEIKLTPQPQPPQPRTITPPPPEQPPIITDSPRAVDVQAPPPAPPTPPRPAVPSGPARNNADLRQGACYVPPVGPLNVALSKAMRDGNVASSMSLTVNYAESGEVTSVSVKQGSRNRDLDRAAMAWARKLKLCPGSAGTGILPLDLVQN